MHHRTRWLTDGARSVAAGVRDRLGRSAVWTPAKLYLLWIAVHHAAANAYVYFCAPTDVGGMVKSVFVVPAPHCRGLRWAVDTGAEVIEGMWGMLAVWLAANVLITPRNAQE